MNIVAIAKNVRGSARKARIPAEVVKGMSVDEALPVLNYMDKAAAKDVWKVVKSAKSNAMHNYGVLPENLYIENIQVNKALKMKRFKAGSRGMAKPIAKQFCHIKVELKDASVMAVENDKKVSKKEDKKESTSTKKVEKKAVAKKTVKKTVKKAKKADK